MIRPYITIFLCCLTVLMTSNVKAQGFLRTEGKAIVDENGNNVLLRGMGLGGWMVQEGYMLQTAGFASPQHQIRERIEDLIGAESTQEFYDAWLENHVQKVDIDSLKSWGFNSVRLPMHYNLFTLSIEDEPVAGQQTWLDKGFELTDQLIEWCKANEMYVILDLHAAPGGQGYDEGISDYDPDKPSLWQSFANRTKMVALWKRLAERYKDEPWVGGYDLLNEPNWDLPGGTALRSLYVDCTNAIREVDTNHIIFIEGNWFANDFTGLTPPWDDNMVYSPHKYWSTNDKGSIQWVLSMRDEYNIPLYLGESGENSNVWFRDAIKLLEDENIGWAWWPMKKVEAIAGPLSAKKTIDYQGLLNYWSNGGNKPNAIYAKETLMELAENFKMENCFYQKDVIDAMIRQVQSNTAIPYNTQTIPGIVYASDFDMGTAGVAYNDVDLATYHVSTGEFTAWNTGWAYRNDGVDLEKSTDIKGNGYNVGWLDVGEWMQYDVNVEETGVYEVKVRLATSGTAGRFHLSMDGSDITNLRYVPSTGGYQNWQEATVRDVVLTTADKKLRFYSDGRDYNFSLMEFTKTGEMSSVETEFVNAVALNQNTIELQLNKPMEAISSNAGFEVFIDNVSIPISNVESHPSNPRVVLVTVGETMTSNDFIKISYTGSNVTAVDGVSLTTFNREDVQNKVVISHVVPGRVQAEDYFFQTGVQLENASDLGGGQNVGYLDNGDYMDYNITVDQAGTYSVTYRTASQQAGQLELQLLGQNGGVSTLHTVDFAATGDWQSWSNTTGTLNLPEGLHQIRILVTKAPFNINWFEFGLITSTEDVQQWMTLNLFPNPSQDKVFLRGDLPAKEDVTIRVYNLMGKVVWQKDLEGVLEMREELDLKGLASGQYLVDVRTLDGGVWRGKVLRVE